MVHQSAANRQFGDDGNAQRTQVICRADARAQQNGRTAVDPCRKDRGRRALNATFDETHPPGVAAFDDHPIGLDLTADRQIRTTAHIVGQIHDAGVLPHAVDDIEWIWANSVLFSPIEIIDALEPDSAASLDKSAQRWRERCHGALADREGAMTAMPGVIAGLRVFQPFIRLEHLWEGPPLKALAPAKKICSSRPQSDSAIHGRTSAEHLAANDMDRMANVAGLTQVFPIMVRIPADEIRIS
jgi:hypothetical protein